jgi:Glycosyl transferase family 2
VAPWHCRNFVEDPVMGAVSASAIGGRLVAGGTVAAGVFTAHTALNTVLMRRPSLAPAQCLERVTVCVPVRNEEDNIARCLRSILSSAQVRSFDVVVLDDGSTDRTAAIVRELLAEYPQVPSRLISGGDAALPNGWLGKTWACERLRLAAEGSVLVFVDADVTVQPQALAASVELLRERDLQLLSPYPRQIAITGGERLIQPLLQWLWLTFLPLRMAERARPVSMAAGNGQFMVLDAAALSSVDGFGCVRGEVLDDVALVRAFKRSGHRGTVADGTNLATCRMYTDWSSVRAGYAKNLWAATGSIPGAVGLGSVLGLTYVVPPAAMVFASTRRVGAVGYLFGVAGRLMTARATGGRKVDSVLHPLSIVTLLRLIVGSWTGKRRGTLSWKGRHV